MRYERKYRITDLDFHQVLNVVRAHPLSFRTAYPDRQVNNIYLDSLAFADFEENLKGVSQRSKCRIRWYGADMLHVTKPTMELKAKNAGLGDKTNIALPDFEIRGVRALRADLESVFQGLRQQWHTNPQDQVAWQLALSGLRPSLISSYVRSYYLSMDGKYRLTIDRDMRFYNPDYPFRPGRNYAEDHAIIVEVKYEADADEKYDLVGRHMPFQLTRNSKYVNGVLLVTP